MAVPNKYQTTSDNSIRSLSLSDTATGKGYITLYATAGYTGITGSNVATGYKLIPSAFPAGKLKTGSSGGTTITFDLKILRPIIVEGDCFVTFTTESPASVSGQISCILQSSGASIVNLASASGAITSGATARRQFFAMNIPRTIFKQGEYFRVQAQSGNAVGEATDIWHDPSSRKNTSANEPETGATENTDFIVNLPIKII